MTRHAPIQVSPDEVTPSGRDVTRADMVGVERRC